MLDEVGLIKIVKELNDDVENEIEDLSTISKFSVETEGDNKGLQIKLGGCIYWTDEEEEIDSKEDLMEIILERLLHHKTQVDGMIDLYRNKLGHV